MKCLNEVEKIKHNDKVVVELSSFQLQTMKMSPKIAVVTNITPNHLDWHTDFDEYISAKKTIFLNQGSDGKVVLNYDNDITREFNNETANGIYFSRKNRLNNGYCLNDDMIISFYNDGHIEREILSVEDIFLECIM